jgi:hypothetical protein
MFVPVMVSLFKLKVKEKLLQVIGMGAGPIRKCGAGLGGASKPTHTSTENYGI